MNDGSKRSDGEIREKTENEDTVTEVKDDERINTCVSNKEDNMTSGRELLDKLEDACAPSVSNNDDQKSINNERRPSKPRKINLKSGTLQESLK